VLDVSSARMSVPFSCAIALVRASAGVQDFCEGNVQCPEIIQLARRIYVKVDERLTALLPEERVAEVVFHATDGSQETIRIDQAKGEPENPMTDKQLSQKFQNLAGYADISPEAMDSIESAVWSFSDSTRSLFNLL
jgi:2-methylcitrate dehydratase PrpD